VSEVQWAGCISDPQIIGMWAPDVEIRIPDGAEWVAPEPESSNHFVSAWVFSPRDKTIHVDDSICYISDPPFLVKLLAGAKKGHFLFHPSLTGPALHRTGDAPLDFKAWVDKLLQDWDFDNACCAHVENKVGGAHAALEEAIQDIEPKLLKLAAKHKSGHEKDKTGKDKEDCAKYNVSGNECG